MLFKVGNLIKGSFAYDDYCPNGIGVITKLRYDDKIEELKIYVYWSNEKKIMWHYAGEIINLIEKCSK